MQKINILLRLLLIGRWKLFDHLSKFKRIVNVEQISIAALPVQTDRTITADFIAKTFVYVEPKEPEPPAKGAKK